MSLFGKIFGDKQSNTRDANELFEKGKSAFLAHNVDTGVKLFRESIDLDPTISDKIFDFAYALHAGAKHKNQLIGGNIYYSAGFDELDSAIAIFELLSEKEPQKADIWSNLGLVYDHRCRFDDSIRCYEKAAALDPEGMDGADALNDLAIQYKNTAFGILGQKNDKKMGGLIVISFSEKDIPLLKKAEETFLRAIEAGKKAYLKNPSYKSNLIRKHRNIRQLYFTAPPLESCEIESSKSIKHCLEILKLDPNDQEAQSWIKKAKENTDTNNSNKMRGGWSEKLKIQLVKARNGDKQAYAQIIDLIYENPIPTNSPMMSYQDVTLLLKCNRRGTPDHEIDAVETAAEYQTWHEEVRSLISETKKVLLGFPSSSITGDNIELLFDAAGYELNIFNSNSNHTHAGVPHVNVYVNFHVNGGKKSMAAVKQLCTEKTPLTSNILNKILNKRDFSIKTGSCNSYKEETIRFTDERKMAKIELEQRGNPSYDPKNYFIN